MAVRFAGDCAGAAADAGGGYPDGHIVRDLWEKPEDKERKAFFVQ